MWKKRKKETKRKNQCTWRCDLKTINSEKQKEKRNEYKWKESKGFMWHHQKDTHIMWALREERGKK